MSWRHIATAGLPATMNSDADLLGPLGASVRLRFLLGTLSSFRGAAVASQGLAEQRHAASGAQRS